MSFKYVSFTNFRNIKNQKINTDANEIFLVGENGQGKSNFLESIYYLNYGSSFRTFFDKDAVNYNEKFFTVKGVKEYDDNIQREIVVSYSNESKNILLDGKKIKDRKKLVDINPCIVFCYDDIKYISGGPSFKRKFIDQTISLFDSLYLDNLRNYYKLLKMRNSALKDNRTDIINAIDHNLIQSGLYIQNSRKNLIKSIDSIFSNLFNKLSGIPQKLKVVYFPSWNIDFDFKEIKNKMVKNIYQDKHWKTTTSGPHRDNFKFFLEKNDFLKSASTGQIRLLALLLKVVQAKIFVNITKKYPIILMDDALLELDVKKRIIFFEIIPVYDQAFFAFLPDEPFNKYAKDSTIIYKVDSGEIYEYGKS